MRSRRRRRRSRRSRTATSVWRARPLLPTSSRAKCISAASKDEAKRIASRLLIHHAVAQRADAGNLDLEHVTGLHPQGWIAAVTHPFPRAGGDHVTRDQWRGFPTGGEYLRHRIE